MKKNILQPVISDENTIVQFTDRVTVEKALAVTVPNGYQAVIFIDEKVLFRIDPCVGKRLADYGKELIGKQCCVAFVRTKAVPAMAWGFGNIQVKNARLKEAYRAGANGKYFVEIVQVPKLIGHFTNDNNITVEKLRDYTIPIIKNIGTALLGEYFAHTDISVFEISAHSAELRKNLLNSLQGESAFASVGLKLKDLTVDGIYVNEDDLALIRSRINETQNEEDNANQPLQYQEILLGELSRRIDEGFENLRECMRAEDNSSEVDEKIQKLRDDIATDITAQIEDKLQDITRGISDENTARKRYNEVLQKLGEESNKLRDSLNSSLPSSGSGQLSKLREELIADITSQIGEKMQNMQDTISDSIEEKFQALLPLNEKAKEEYIKNIKITARVCIEKAVDEDGLVPAVAMMYTNIEENLIKKFRLRYENKKFVMAYDEYRSLAEEEPALLSRYDVLSPTVFEDDDGEEVVELPPQVRFYEAGLNVSDSLKARDYWCFMNKMRHKSPENDKFLRRRFLNFAQWKKYIFDALDFFRAHGLYTKD